MYREDKDEGAGSSVTDQASTKIKDQSISLKTSTSLAEREVGGRSGAEGRIPEQHVCGLKGREERRCMWGAGAHVTYQLWLSVAQG